MQDMITTIQGNATRDPRETRHQDGSVTATVRVAVNGRYFDRTAGEFADRRTEYVTVFARRSLARNVLASVRKGEPLIVTGRIASSEWKREDGQSEFTMTLQAHAIGHDLSYGTGSYTRTARRQEEPDIDEDSGEVRGILGAEAHGASDPSPDTRGEAMEEKELVSTSAPF